MFTTAGSLKDFKYLNNIKLFIPSQISVGHLKMQIEAQITDNKISVINIILYIINTKLIMKSNTNEI